MKRLILAFALALSIVSLKAQTELKINPIGVLFASPDLSAEFGVSQNFGIEPYVGLSWFNLTVDDTKYSSNGVGYGVHGKYYFGSESNLSKFYGGMYLRGGHSKFKTSDNSESFTRDRLGLGFELGYKWVTQKNIVFEVAGGAGRKLFSKYSNTTGSVNTTSIPLLNFDGFFRFCIGYRFGGGEKG
jgi:hypothetical protein